MSKKTARASTLYGPVDIALMACDGPECATCVQESLVLGWFSISPLGAEVKAFGALPDPMQFCSLSCLAKAVDLMTGRVS